MGFPKVKPLTKEREAALIKAWKEEQDENAMHEVICAHSPMVGAMARTYSRRYGVLFEDLVSEGHVALLKTMEKFDLSRNFRFSTYAKWQLMQQMRNFIRHNTGDVHLPTSSDGMKNFPLGSRVPTMSLSEPVSEGSVLADVIPAPDENVELKVDANSIRRHLDCLSERERYVIEERYLQNSSKTLDQVGTACGISKERVRQIEFKAIGKLRNRMEVRV